MVQIIWTAAAMRDRESIGEYIADDNPEAAQTTDTCFVEMGQLLSRFPRAGREGRVSGTREMAVGGTPYILIYRIQQESLLVVRVLHGAQQWP
jgi:addiction module RelE/StbE family toxin